MQLANSKQSREALQLVYRPIAELLEDVVKCPVFFVALEPGRWAVRYVAVDVEQAPEIADRIRRTVTAFLAERSEHASNEIVDALYEFSKPALADVASDELRRGALSILLATDEVRLGWTNKPGTWRLPRGDERQLKWVQDALEFAHNHQLGRRTTSIHPAYQPLVGGDGRNVGIVVPQYLARQGLVETEENELTYFLGEALSALTGDVYPDARPTDLKHYFVPLAGLGQWRATACWVSPNDLSEEAKQGLTETLRQLLEENFTQHLLRSVPAYFGEALRAPAGEPKLSAVIGALSALWWVDDVTLFREGRPLYRQSRDPIGDLAPAPPVDLDSPSTRNCPTQPIVQLENGDLQLDFVRLAGVSGATVRGALGCDSARIRMQLFQTNRGNPVRVLDKMRPELGHYLASILGPHRVEVVERESQRLKQAMEAYATLQHELNKLFEKEFMSIRTTLERDEITPLVRRRVLYAWDVLRSFSDVAYYLGKARLGADDQQRKDLFERFREPLLELWNAGLLETAIEHVAKVVYEGAARSRTVRSIATFEASPVNTDLRLTPDQFGRCYMLCAEPIRNFLQHGPHGIATWSATVSSVTGLRIILTHDAIRDALKPPSSSTFEGLAAFLSFDPTWDAEGRVGWGTPGKTVCWYVGLGVKFFSELPK